MLDPAVQPTETQIWIIRRTDGASFGGDMSDRGLTRGSTRIYVKRASWRRD